MAGSSLIEARRGAYEHLYQECKFGGYSRHDGAVHFYTRVQSLLTGSSVVCDLGCGRGFHKMLYEGFARTVQVCRGLNRHVIGVDVDKYATENPYIDEFRLIGADGRLPLEDSSIDVVVSEWVFEHLEQPLRTLAEASRVLKPGGVICIRTPNRWHYSSLGASMIPNQWHHHVRRILRQPHDPQDVFPTYYRCNSKGAMQRTLMSTGFESAVYRHRGPSHLVEAGQFLGRVGECLERLSPSAFLHEIHAFGRKMPT